MENGFFKGLTYFGIPIEYLLRIGEVWTIIVAAAFIGGYFYFKYENKFDKDIFSKFKGRWPWKR